MRTIWAWAMTAMVALGAGTLGAQPAGSPSASTLVVGLPADPVGLDPAQVADLNSLRVGLRIAETLVAFPDERAEVVPGLAESWAISRDGLVYTFRLRSGVKFHDGTPLDAAAVVFSIARQIDPSHPAHALGRYPFAAYFFGNVRSVDAIDAGTVRFVLREPRASFLAALASGAAVVVSPAAILKAGADSPLRPVGTGPFRLAIWERGRRLVLDRNPEYWKFPVTLDQVEYRPIAEDQTRVLELMTGSLDLIVGVPADLVPRLEGHPRLAVLRQPAVHVWYLGINNQKKPFDDRRVRQALNFAVNKDALVRDVLRGTGAVAHGPILPGTWAAVPGPPAFPHDPTRARRLLAEAGYPNGFSATLWVPDRGAGMQSPVAMSIALQSDLRAVGVNVSLRTMEWGTFVARLRTREHELFALSYMAGSEDPDMLLYPLLHSSQWAPGGANRALYRNPRFDALLDEARRVTDQGARAELYRAAQRLLVEDAPWVFVDHEVQIAAFARRVQGFKLHPSFDVRVETISLR